MSQIPQDMRYATTHEWARSEEDGLVTIGITDHAQDALGDIVFVEPPDVGADLMAGDEAGVVESVKAASDIYAPVSGKVVAVNQALEESPDAVNTDPYGEGWFFRLQPTDPGELNDLMDAESYQHQVDNED